jgi:O-methyltransferase
MNCVHARDGGLQSGIAVAEAGDMQVQGGIRNRIRLEVQRGGRALLRRLLARRYSLVVPNFYRVYTPWFEDDFRRLLQGCVLDNTLLTEDRCYFVQQFVRYAAQLPGDFAECGVYRGGSAYLMAETMRAAGSAATLHLFDTFEGMPDTARPESDSHAQGDFGDVSYEGVVALLRDFTFASLHRGFIPHTFAGLDTTYCFAHIDVDIYSTTHDCLEYFYPRLHTGGILLFDDYGHRIYEHAQRRAVDEFFALIREKPIVLPTGQAFVIKL